MPHEVGDVLAQVAPRVEPEMLLGNGIAPFDLIVIVKHGNAVRRCLNGLNEARMLLLDLTHLRVPAFGEFMQPIVYLAPDAGRARHLAVDRRIEQAPEPFRVIGTEQALYNER